MLDRRVEIRLSVGGLEIIVGDPTLGQHRCVMTFLNLQTYSDNGLLADAVEDCVRRCHQHLKAPGA